MVQTSLNIYIVLISYCSFFMTVTASDRWLGTFVVILILRWVTEIGCVVDVVNNQPPRTTSDDFTYRYIYLINFHFIQRLYNEYIVCLFTMRYYYSKLLYNKRYLFLYTPKCWFTFFSKSSSSSLTHRIVWHVVYMYILCFCFLFNFEKFGNSNSGKFVS